MLNIALTIVWGTIILVDSDEVEITAIFMTTSFDHLVVIKDYLFWSVGVK